MTNVRQDNTGTLSKLFQNILKFCYEFATLCDANYRICYGLVFTTNRKQICQCYLDAALASCPIYFKVISKFFYEFAAFCFIIFRICYGLIFSEFEKNKNNSAPANCPIHTKVVPKF